MARHQLTYSIANNILLLLVFNSNSNNNSNNKNGHVYSYTLPANQVFTRQLFDRGLFQQVTTLKNHRHAQDIYQRFVQILRNQIVRDLLQTQNTQDVGICIHLITRN